MRDDAVSDVIGEMLMISLVLLLIAVFAASFGNCLPTERAPTVTVKMTNTTDDITLYHKGGDWVRAADLEVVISNATATREYRTADSAFEISPEKQIFDLGSTITVPYQTGDERVRLVTSRAILFSGEVV